MVTTRPLSKLKADFEQLLINGIPHPFSKPGQIPSEHGVWIDMGDFETSTEIEVHWRFMTGIRAPEDDVLTGHCPNFKLTKLVRLERMKLEPLTDYDGTFRVKPERI
ncbi:hypothetical protein [Lysobacter sp. CA196]|uniref:hypothetical protein n=1 Tax=Lysobacter sp. CA196 TaxID=3455606 RepID=UPI003F8D2059